MSNIICKIEELTIENIDDFGTKAVNLSMLHKNGFNISPGYALSKEVFEKFLRHNNLSIDLSESFKYKVLKGKMPDNIEKQIHYMWDSLNNEKDSGLIVRSSAIGEDGENYSFAGIYESFQNIRTYEDLVEHIKKCWIACFSKTAQDYREKQGLHFGGIGIVIQKMIAGDVSGVLFTVNPVNKDKNEVLIEALYGLNISLVEGRTTADRYIVDRNGSLKEQFICKKNLHYYPGMTTLSINVKSVSADEQDCPCLSNEDIINLTQTGVALERLFRAASDIEWTIKDGVIYLLQIRPITNLNKKIEPVIIHFDADIPADVECSLLDRYSEPACTAYLSLLKSWEELVYLSFYSKERGARFEQKPLMFYFNRVYWNLKYQKEFFDDVPFNGNGLPALIKKTKLVKLMLFGYKNWYKRVKKYIGYIEEIEKHDIKRLNAVQLSKLYHQTIDIFCNFIGRDHFQFLGIAQVSYNLLSEKLKDMPESKNIIARIIESNVSQNMTMVSNRELVEIAQLAENNELLKKAFKEHASSMILDLVKKEEYTEFNRKFEAFLKKHGHRGTSCDDLYTPHWGEEPVIVIELIKQFLTNPDYSPVVAKDKSKEYKKHIELISNYIKESCNTFIKATSKKVKIKFLIKIATEYMTLRENQRYYFDKSWILLRKILLAMGDLHVEQGNIENRKDMFHLSLDEMNELNFKANTDITKDWKRIVEVRKKVYEKNSKVVPPYLIKNNEIIRLQKKGIHKSYKAIGISPGNTVGRVRIISGINDLCKVNHGEVAVVSTFHPSWTPILGIVGGLIMNYGNILSHGAVVAREYGIPVVVFNDVATQLLKEDQWVEVDGTNGRVRVYDSQDSYMIN
ncbi:MAG: PEP/pyruvate-binding domain-containing protein [Bacillota bacterium]